MSGLYVLGTSLIPPLLITLLRVRTQTCLPSGSIFSDQILPYLSEPRVVVGSSATSFSNFRLSEVSGKCPGSLRKICLICESPVRGR